MIGGGTAHYVWARCDELTLQNSNTAMSLPQYLCLPDSSRGKARYQLMRMRFAEFPVAYLVSLPGRLHESARHQTSTWAYVAPSNTDTRGRAVDGYVYYI